MKKVFGNVYTQLFLGFIVGFIGTTISIIAAFIFSVKYSGWSFFDVGSIGDKSPFTLIISILFLIVAFLFPICVWLLLKKIWNLNLLSKKMKIITFIFFLLMPLWFLLYLSF